MNIYKRIGLQLRTFGLLRVGGASVFFFFFQRNRILDQIKVVCKAGVEFDVMFMFKEIAGILSNTWKRLEVGPLGCSKMIEKHI